MPRHFWVSKQSIGSTIVNGKPCAIHNALDGDPGFGAIHVVEYSEVERLRGELDFLLGDRPKNTRDAVTPEMRKQVWALRKEGESLAAIARIVGLSSSTVHAICIDCEAKEKGIKR